MRQSLVEVAVNGRFLTRPPTGVDRVGRELVVALQSLDNTKVKTIVPDSTKTLQCNRDIPSVSHGNFKGHVWEQLQLSHAIDQSILLSPCNVGPLSVRNQIVIIHDAQVYLTPKAYSKLFVWWYRFVLPLLAKRVKKIVTVSNYSKIQLVKNHVAPADKIVVIPNGGDHILKLPSDVSILRRYNLVSGKYWLAVGSRSSHKNIKLLYEVMRARQSGSCPLIIVGGGDSNVYSFGDTVGTEGIILAGRVNDGQLRALYENAKALLFPSLFEGFGLPPLEAMYLSCPVVASTATAIPEVCGDAVIYADPSKVEEWISAMDTITMEVGVRERLVVAGLNQASKFTWARAAKSLRQVMDELIV